MIQFYKEMENHGAKKNELEKYFSENKLLFYI